METSKLTILTSPLFIIGLAVLLLNDFILKPAFGNFLTGKLSDFVGLFVFSLFWAAFFPNKKVFIHVFTAILFIWWISPFSQGLLDSWNSLHLWNLRRVIDVSDFIAILILPVSYYYFRAYQLWESRLGWSSLKNGFTAFMILISIFAFSATSFEQDRKVDLSGEFLVQLSRNEFETKLQSLYSVRDISISHMDIGYAPNVSATNQETFYNFYFAFELDVPYCESKRVRFSGVLDTEDLKKNIKFVSAGYWCKNPPSDADKAALLSLFEREIIAKIEPNRTQ